jgi:DNA-directed RNA polymerase specialized sigma24 family protein
MDDRALLDRLKDGDQAAFDEVFRAHYPALVILAQSLLHDRSASEDVVQEVMLELWRRRTAVTIQESLRAYLVRSTRNGALNQIRTPTSKARLPPGWRGKRRGGGRAGPCAAGRDAIRAAVAELPPACREAFRLEPSRDCATGDRGTLGISGRPESQMEGAGSTCARVSRRGCRNDSDLTAACGGVWSNLILLTPRWSRRQTQGGR